MFLCFILFSLSLYTQNNTATTLVKEEEKSIKFQENFFKALAQKAIYKYKIAITHLEVCNNLIPNNTAVLFELSKNYLKLNKTFEAISYIKLALENEPENIWLLEHLVTLHKKEYNFTEAIAIQEKISSNHPKKKRALVFLHLQNRDVKKAKKILEELEKEKLLTSYLQRIKKQLYRNKEAKKTKITVQENTNKDSRSVYLKDKSFKNLKNLLSNFHKTSNKDLLKFSEEGLSLYPAQPFVYLMHARALYINNNFEKAIISLQNGIDFVINNSKLKTEFYKEFVKNYGKLKDLKNRKKYQEKLNAL